MKRKAWSRNCSRLKKTRDLTTKWNVLFWIGSYSQFRSFCYKGHYWIKHFLIRPVDCFTVSIIIDFYNCTVVIYRITIVFRKCTLRYLKVSLHYVSNLFSNSSEKAVCVCVHVCVCVSRNLDKSKTIENLE